jgi:hypothetical protein
MNKNAMSHKNKFLITMQFEENFFLPIFLKHYSRYFPPNNIFVIDHGSNVNIVPSSVNRIYIPRDKPFSEQDRLELIQHLSYGLLKYYDSGVYADCDELICLDKFKEDDFNTSPVIFVAGFECFFIQNENEKKLIGLISPTECKPLIFKTVPTWIRGFHATYKSEHSPLPFLDIPMAHIKFLYKGEAQNRALNRRQVYEKFDEYEKSNRIAEHWGTAENQVNMFYSQIQSLTTKSTMIEPFTKILRDEYFAIKSFPDASNKQYSNYYSCKGDYKSFSKLYDLTNCFQDIMSPIQI